MWGGAHAIFVDDLYHTSVTALVYLLHSWWKMWMLSVLVLWYLVLYPACPPSRKISGSMSSISLWHKWHQDPLIAKTSNHYNAFMWYCMPCPTLMVKVNAKTQHRYPRATSDDPYVWNTSDVASALPRGGLTWKYVMITCTLSLIGFQKSFTAEHLWFYNYMFCKLKHPQLGNFKVWDPSIRWRNIKSYYNYAMHISIYSQWTGTGLWLMDSLGFFFFFLNHHRDYSCKCHLYQTHNGHCCNHTFGHLGDNLDDLLLGTKSSCNFLIFWWTYGTKPKWEHWCSSYFSCLIQTIGQLPKNSVLR